jgi:nitroimidazol reductase NimA-like FMN-containing flavoprotein (pyridoxamine 5'-phosphate oxidase superfamily)
MPTATAHSLDYHSVVWFGRQYEFTANQAACVAVLWQAWENRTPVVGAQTILVEAGLETARLDIVFRKHPAWNTMIVRGDRRGNYRLAEPRCAKVKGKR